MKPYYQLSGEEVLREVNGSEEPLTKEQVSENQKKYGPNELTEGKKKTTVQIFLEQYKDFLVIILIIAAIASGFMGDIESAAVIVIVITMNAILGTVQTVKAEQSLQSLKKLACPEAKVLRDGVTVQLPARELVVGDVILLEAGDMIPADGRLIENASLKLDESALTGESPSGIRDPQKETALRTGLPVFQSVPTVHGPGQRYVGQRAAGQRAAGLQSP